MKNNGNVRRRMERKCKWKAGKERTNGNVRRKMERKYKEEE